MMGRVRWWAMYFTSCAVGYLLAAVMLLLGFRHARSPFELARTTARSHAADAEFKDGPYLAPVTLLASLVVLAVGAMLVWRLS